MVIAVVRGPKMSQALAPKIPSLLSPLLKVQVLLARHLHALRVQPLLRRRRGRRLLEDRHELSTPHGRRVPRGARSVTLQERLCLDGRVQQEWQDFGARSLAACQYAALSSQWRFRAF